MTRLRQQGLILLVVAVLAGVPVLGTVCIALCAPAPGGAAHARPSEGDHAAHCEDGVATAAVSIGASPLHSCGRHDVAHIGGTLGVAPGRADTGVLLVALATGSAISGLLGPVVEVLRTSTYSPPISPPSPTRAPLVLRI